MEITLTLETLQHKSSSLSISMTKTHMSKNSHAPKKVMSHIKKSMPHQNVTTTKILPQPNFLTCPYTTTKFFHSHAKRKNSYMTKIKFPTSSCTNKFSHNQNHNHTNFPRINIIYPTKFFHKSKLHTHKICQYPQIYLCTYPQNFAISIKQSLHIPINFSHIHHEHIHISLTQIFHNAILSKSKPKFIQQHHNLPTLSKFQKPPTLSKLHPKKTHFKNSPKPIFPNTINHTMPPKFQNNQMTISHHETFNETCNNIFPRKETKEKLTLGPRVLKKSIIIMSIKCWIIFLTMKSKKRRSLGGRSHFDAKKMGLENGFHQKWVYDESAQNTRI